MIIEAWNSEINVELAKIYMDEKDKDSANIYFNKAIECYTKIIDKKLKMERPYYIGRDYYNLACVYCQMENKTDALKYLDLSLQKDYKEFEHINIDKDLDFIRNTSEFKALIEKYSKTK